MATQLQIYQEVSRLLGDVRLATVTDDVDVRYSIDEAYARGITYVLRAAPWRFALKTATLSTSGSPISGFTISSALPSGWLRTHSIFVLAEDSRRECPIDCRQHDTKVYSRATPIMRYLSSAAPADDPANFPEHFTKALTAYIAFDIAERVRNDPAKAGQLFELYQRFLQEAMLRDADPESPWLRYQLDGSFYRGARQLLDKAFWRFAVKTTTMLSTRGPERLTNGALDSDTGWTKGTGWTIHSSAAHKAPGTGSDLSQASSSIVEGVQYEFTFTIANRTAGGVFARLAGSTDVDGTTYTADGTYTEILTAVAGHTGFAFRGNTGFAGDIHSLSVRQVRRPAVPSPGYGYAFVKPGDFARVFQVSSTLGSGVGAIHNPVEFRDERGFLHANFDPIELRYVSTDGEDSTVWSDYFMAALLAQLQLDEAMMNPDMAGAKLQARAVAAQELLKRARENDDLTEQPKVNRTGVLARARLGYYGGGWLNREMGY